MVIRVSGYLRCPHTAQNDAGAASSAAPAGFVQSSSGSITVAQGSKLSRVGPEVKFSGRCLKICGKLPPKKALQPSLRKTFEMSLVAKQFVLIDRETMKSARCAQSSPIGIKLRWLDGGSTIRKSCRCQQNVLCQFVSYLLRASDSTSPKPLQDVEMGGSKSR